MSGALAPVRLRLVYILFYAAYLAIEPVTRLPFVGLGLGGVEPVALQKNFE
jgi:hypothetical protein